MKYLIILFFLSKSLFVNSQSVYDLDINSVEARLSNINKAEQIIQFDPTSIEVNKLLKYQIQNDSIKSFTFDDINFKYFVLGACCWQYGAIYLIAKKNVTREDKLSFCMGASTNVIVFIAGVIIDSGLLDNLNNLSIF